MTGVKVPLRPRGAAFLCLNGRPRPIDGLSTADAHSERGCGEKLLDLAVRLV